MNMTHYMQLLAENQPWNLLIFMATPVVLAETVAITELYLLYTRNYGGAVHGLNRFASIVGGAYFAGVFVYLLVNAVIPLTRSGGWRGPADVIAVLSYLAGVVPLVGIALVDLKLVARERDEHARMALHATFVAIFLIVAHVAMVFGMLDPTLLGAAAAHAAH
ncbi:MAG: permease [Methylobacteriaceae bacterium]|nr:permease [Methylobacteriaceae bacterium]